MKIAVFGTGIVGQTIANRLVGLNHSVTIGTRDVNKTLSRTEKDMYGNPSFGEWYNQNKNNLQLSTYANAASSSDIIFLCTMGQGSVEALKQAGDTNLKGKTIIDISNPLDFSKGAPPSLSPVNTDSLGELIQRTFPEAKVVKTLNTMNCFLMVNPAALPGDHNVFVSGNDDGAKKAAKEILKSFGWNDSTIIDLGDITTARGTEQLLPIWIRLYTALQNPMFNFKIVVGPKK
ncbi:DNA-binding protein [Cytophagales bacterium WSM2-2]|nr:DNA-binding protein [Cytophagales bacterium WSM2-2]